MHINNDFSSPNNTPRTKKIKYVILHYTEMIFDEALKKLIDPSSSVSSHYFINKNGEIFQLVSDDKIAWHAGESHWLGADKLNQNSIGIEIDNLGIEDFTKKQMKSVIELCLLLKTKYKLSEANFLGHSDIAPSRKIDPGIFFNWQLLAQNKIGLWHNVKYLESLADQILLEFGESSNEVIKMQKKLQKFGYKIALTGKIDTQTSYVIRSFQSRFVPKIIHNKGGLVFYRNLSANYNWDKLSDVMLEKLYLNLL